MSGVVISQQGSTLLVSKTLLQSQRRALHIDEAVVPSIEDIAEKNSEIRALTRDGSLDVGHNVFCLMNIGDDDDFHGLILVDHMGHP